VKVRWTLISTLVGSSVVQTTFALQWISQLVSNLRAYNLSGTNVGPQASAGESRCSFSKSSFSFLFFSNLSEKKMSMVYVLCLFAVLLSSMALALAPPLPFLTVHNATVSVSGFDSGAMFATQLQFSYSSRIKAFLIATGGPYLCGQGNVDESAVCMTNPELLDNSLYESQAAEFVAAQKIDNTSNLANHFVYLLSAPLDTVVVQGTTELLQSMYQDYSVASVYTLYNLTDAAHAWITNNHGKRCDHLGPIYLNNCHYDVASDFLSQAFQFFNVPGGFNNNTSTGYKPYKASLLVEFDQTAFGANVSDNSMGDTGYVYIPPQCYSAKCHLHVHLHGCEQGKDYLGGSSYVSQTGLNEWAEANNIVILYPQVAPNALKFNPLGCWDWFGYNTKDPLNYLEYGTKDGFEVQMVWQMIDQLIDGL
jgi:hypothetical protein